MDFPAIMWVKGQVIGRGSLGQVYQAMNLTTGEMIAVRQVGLPKTDSERADLRKQTIIDAVKLDGNTLRELDHPHIVQYLGFEETVDAFSVFFEYVPGGSIRDILRNVGKLEDEVTRSFSHQIIDGLAYLHKSALWEHWCMNFVDLSSDNDFSRPDGSGIFSS